MPHWDSTDNHSDFAVSNFASSINEWARLTPSHTPKRDNLRSTTLTRKVRRHRHPFSRKFPTDQPRLLRLTPHAGKNHYHNQPGSIVLPGHVNNSCQAESEEFIRLPARSLAKRAEKVGAETFLRLAKFTRTLLRSTFSDSLLPRIAERDRNSLSLRALSM